MNAGGLGSVSRHVVRHAGAGTCIIQGMSGISRREVLLAIAFIAPGARAVYAFQGNTPKTATVTLIVAGMT